MTRPTFKDRPMTRRMTTLAAAGLLALTASAAHAQLSSHSHAPIDITADEQEVVNSQCTSIWRGDAEALQDTTRLRARTIKGFATITTAANGGKQAQCGATERMEAEGEVFYVTPDRTVRGDKAVYTAASDTVVVTGDVILVQGKNVATGERLTLNNKTGEAHLESSVRGRNKPGRVRGVFYPSEDKSGAPPKPAAQR